MDFSCDGQYLQCDSQKGGELLFFDAERCIQFITFDVAAEERSLKIVAACTYVHAVCVNCIL